MCVLSTFRLETNLHGRLYKLSLSLSLFFTHIVIKASWPAFTPYNRQVRKEYLFFREFLKNIRLTALKLKVQAPKCVYIYMAVTYEPKKVSVVKCVHVRVHLNLCRVS